MNVKIAGQNNVRWVQELYVYVSCFAASYVVLLLPFHVKFSSVQSECLASVREL